MLLKGRAAADDSRVLRHNLVGQVCDEAPRFVAQFQKKRARIGAAHRGATLRDLFLARGEVLGVDRGHLGEGRRGKRPLADE